MSTMIDNDPLAHGRTSGGSTAPGILDKERTIAGIGFMTQEGVRPSRALDASLAFMKTPEWQSQVQQHSGTLGA